jgi:hypothetical protein
MAGQDNGRDALLGLKPRSFVGYASRWYVSAQGLRPSPREVLRFRLLFYPLAFREEPATASFQRTRTAVPVDYGTQNGPASLTVVKREPGTKGV